MGNKTFLSEVGVTKGIYYFPNPTFNQGCVIVFYIQFLLLFPFSSCEIIIAVQVKQVWAGHPQSFKLGNCGTMIQMMVMSQNITSWEKIACIAQILIVRECKMK